MTDLEKLWNDLPTGEPPVDELISSGRRHESRRKRLLTRPLIAAGSVAALVATFVAGAQVGGGDPATAPPQVDARPASFQADLDPAESCSELLTSYRDRALDHVSAWGWNNAGLHVNATRLGNLTDLSAQEESFAKATSSATGTNVQETDVDEPDTVKSDGSRIVRLRGSNLDVYEVSGDSMRKVSSLHLPRLDNAEIMLDGDTVVAAGEDRSSGRQDYSSQRRGSRVVTISLADAAAPAITSEVTYSARILSARQHGSVVRVVLSSGLPALDFVHPRRGKVTQSEALAANREIVKTSTITDWLPTFDSGSGPLPLLDCTDVAIPSNDLGLDTVSVVGIDTASPAEPVAIGLAGATTIAYESPDHLYLAAAAGAESCGPSADCAFSFDLHGTTHLFDFELDGIEARHVASGEVEGTIADRWSLDEADDILRVAVGPSSETGNFNSVVTMRRNGTELAEIGRVDGLGRNEQIKGVRWFDDLAVVVTFRQVDPLYTIDLSSPERPVLLGKLKIPGYSDYLHPVGDDQLLGIGYTGDGASAQVALFDISDLSQARRTDVVTFPAAYALATEDPRAFTWLPDRSTALTVLQRGRAVDLVTITVRDGRLSSSAERVEYGADAPRVRTIELADGTVALVTGEDVRLLALP